MATLLPGMYVRALLTLGVAQSALLVPQQAVSRNARGDASVLVVTADNHVELRNLQLEASAQQPVARDRRASAPVSASSCRASRR